MRGRSVVLVAGLFLAVFACVRQPDDEGQGELVGSVTFPVTCNAEAQRQFDRAVAMLHSFWFEQADATFGEAAAADATCAMAYWGRAMTLWGNPMARAAPSAERASEAMVAIETARELAPNASERERAYIEAAAALYEGSERLDHLARMRAHEDAMRRVVETYPDDVEATIFYGRAIVANASPDDLTFERQMYAASVLEPLFETRPGHPGLAHYIIHAFDAPAIANQGLEAARRYANIAPDAPHALHMPSHIFTRLGHWQESIETNTRSALAEPVPDAAVHPMDYMVYAYLQLGRDREAGEVVARAQSNADRFYGGLIGYNFVAMPARFALERTRWADAAAVAVPDSVLPYVAAVARFARAVGHARNGAPAAARTELGALEELRDALRRRGDTYWATVVEAQRLAAAAWVMRAEGDDDSALHAAGEAADIEASIEKHPVTPGPLLPARELEADLLLELGRHDDALAAYEKTLEREPRRARALFGAARAAELAGHVERARQHYTELLELMAGADADRPELMTARAFLEGRGP